VIGADDGYQSTNVSLIGLDGQSLSPSFISSAGGGAPLSAPLSGDVVAPTSPASSRTVVLLDRAQSVVTWVDVDSAEVRGQLTLGPNPHDYLALGNGLAYVTRFDRKNGSGGDVAVIDPESHTLLRTIALDFALDGAPGVQPAPHRLLSVQGRVLATLLCESPDFQAPAPSRLVLIEPDHETVESYFVLDGAYECNGLGASPSEKQVALSCSGRFHGGSDPVLSESALVIVDVSGQPRELKRVAALGAPFGFAVAYASEHTLLANTFGSETEGRPDTVVEIDLESGERRVLLQAAAFTLGDIRCAPAAGFCFATDAEHGVVQRFVIGGDGHLSAPESFVVESEIGMPPRSLGEF
jgi:hypothetical protein